MFAFCVAVVAALRSTTRSRLELAAEILALRHQLAVLRQRAPTRLRLGRVGRLVWVVLSRVWSGWRETVQIVSPDTVVAWHRQGVALYWRWRPRPRGLVKGAKRADAVRAQELAPTHAAPRANGSEAGVPEPGPHGGGRHGEPKPLQLADDAWVAPARILPGQPQDQFAEFRVERWATGSLRICPTLGYQAPMPGQQRLRRDDQRRPPSAREQPARGREEEPVGPRHPRSGLPPPEDGERENPTKRQITQRDQRGLRTADRGPILPIARVRRWGPSP
jgi:hypothetical protein